MSKHRNPNEDVSLDTIVWRIVAEDDANDFTVGIFSTKEKAEEYKTAVNSYRQKQGWGPHPDWNIEEYELDPVWEEWVDWTMNS